MCISAAITIMKIHYHCSHPVYRINIVRSFNNTCHDQEHSNSSIASPDNQLCAWFKNCRVSNKSFQIMAQFFICTAIVVDLLLSHVFYYNVLYESLSSRASHLSLVEQFHDVIITYNWNVL